MSRRYERAEEVRPRLPWLSRVGTKNGELTQLGMILRGAGAVLVILNPVAMAAMGLVVLALSRTRIRGWWLTVVGGVGSVVALLTGWVAKYNTVWRDLSAAARAAIEERDRSIFLDAFADWPAWLMWQLPAALCFGVFLAGMVLSYRQRYRAVWRDKAKPASRRKIEHTARELARVPTSGVAIAKQPDDLDVDLGVDEMTGKPFKFPARALRMHSAVGGPTGFGKSTTLRRMIDALVTYPAARAAGIGVVFIDMKADAGMIDYLREAARVANRRFHLVTVDPATSARYNPLRHADGPEMTSKLIETEANAADGGFSEPHYRRTGERFLLLCSNVLAELAEAAHTGSFDDGTRRPWRKDLPDLVRLMRPGVLAKEADRLSPTLARRVDQYLGEMKDPHSGLAKDTYGIYTRFALIAEGQAGPILTESPDGVDLPAAIASGDIVLFSLDSAGDAATARQLGNLAVQDVTQSLSLLMDEGFYDAEAGAGGMVFTCVDEFSALGGSLLAGLYARGRAAGAAVCLASQDLDGDLNEVSPAFRTQVLTNANVIVLHQQRNEAPDAWANAIGTHEVWKETIQVTADTGVLGAQEAASGVGSLRETHQFRISPDTFRNLRQGEAVVLVGHPKKQVATVVVSRPRSYPGVSPTEITVAGTDASVSPAGSAPTAARTASDDVIAGQGGDNSPWFAAGTRSTVNTSVESERRFDDPDDDAPVVEPED